MKISTRGASVRPQKACPLSVPRLPCGLGGVRLSVRMAAFGKPEADAAKDAGIPSNIAMPKTAITDSMLDAAAEAEASPKPLPMSGYKGTEESSKKESFKSSSSGSSAANSSSPASGNPTVRYYDYTAAAFSEPFSPAKSTPASPVPPKSTTTTSATIKGSSATTSSSSTTVRSSGPSGLDGGGGGNIPSLGGGKVSGGGGLTTGGGPSGSSGGGIGSNIPVTSGGGGAAVTRSSSLSIGKMGAGGALGVGGSDRGIDGGGGGNIPSLGGGRISGGGGFTVGGNDPVSSQLAYGGGGSGGGSRSGGGGGGGGGKGDSQPPSGSQGVPAPAWLKAMLVAGVIGSLIFVGKTGYESIKGVKQADVQGVKEQEQQRVEKLKEDTGKRLKKGAHKAADAVKGTFEGDKTDYIMRALLGAMGVVAALAFAGITWPKNRGSGGGKKPSYKSNKELSPAGAADVESDDKKRMAKGPVPQTTGPGQATVRVDSSGQTTVATK